MKKSLIALAVLAASSGVAMAQSSVTLSGIIKGGVANTQIKPQDGKSNNGWGVNDGASRFILSGKEDLGGGLNAVFQIEQRFRLDESAASRQANGDTFVGLTGGFGGISIGKRNTHYCYGSDDYGSRSLALQASSCALLGFVNTSVSGHAGEIANSGRSMNIIRYDLPQVYGIRGNVSFSPSWKDGTSESVGDAGKGNAFAGQLEYANGPITVGGSAWKGKTEDRTVGATKGDQTAYTLAGKFNFGYGTVGLTFDQSKYDAGKVSQTTDEYKRSSISIPVSIVMGQGTLLATYTANTDVKHNGVKQKDTKAQLFSIGYDYSLSKRTSVGVSYAMLNNRAASSYALYTQSSLASNLGMTSAVGVDQRQLYVGFRHAF